MDMLILAIVIIVVAVVGSFVFSEKEVSTGTDATEDDT